MKNRKKIQQSTRKPAGALQRGHVVQIRLRIQYTPRFRALHIPLEQAQTMLDHHADAVALRKIKSGYFSSFYDATTPQGTEVEIVIATDLVAGSTIVGLSSEISN